MEGAVSGRVEEQKNPGTGEGPRQGCSQGQGQGPARGMATGSPQGPATATIQVPPSAPREGCEEHPGTTDLDIEEEGQPPGEPGKEQGNEETSGSASKAFGRLRRKVEEEKNQEEGHTLELRKKIQEREKSFSEGSRGVDRPTHMELLVQHKGYRWEREGVVLVLEAAINLMELAEEEQDQQAPTPRSSPHPGRPVSRRTPEDQKSRGTPQKPPKYRRWQGFACRP